MKYARQITYKGRKIWFLDAGNKDEEEVQAAFVEARQVLTREKEGGLYLIDGSNMPVSISILNKAKEAADLAKGDSRYRVAFIGLAGMTKSMADIHAKTRRVNARFFDTLEEAEEWLITAPDNPQKS